MNNYYLEVLNKDREQIVSDALQLGAAGKFEEALRKIEHLSNNEPIFLKALCLLNLGLKQEALKFYQIVASSTAGNFLAPAFCDYITGREEETGRMYSSSEFTEYFKSASKSPVFEGIYLVANNTIYNFFSESDEITFLDIGIGTAKQTTLLIRALENNSKVRKLRIVGVEPYEKMSLVADQALTDQIGKKHSFEIEYQIINKFAQSLTFGDLKTMAGSSGFNVVNASASIHHMVLEDKLKLLGIIKKLKPDLFIISDADSNHESTLLPFSFELIANVTSFYENLFEYMCTKAPDEITKRYYKGFCFFDARNIIIGEHGERIEYHTTADNWLNYLLETGFDIVPPQREWLRGIEPTYSRIYNNHLVSSYYNRSLLFQITARGV